jgi:hypothetical protein
MNTIDILKNGHTTVMAAIDGFPAEVWDEPGVCGVWSTKDIIAHLASFEHLLVDVLNSLSNDNSTPTLDDFFAGNEQFNDAEVNKRRDRTVEEVLAEYNDTHAQTVTLLAAVPAETGRQNGLLPWYGAEYDLEDLIVYSFYGHKREHCAQIDLFRDQLAHQAGGRTR